MTTNLFLRAATHANIYIDHPSKNVLTHTHTHTVKVCDKNLFLIYGNVLKAFDDRFD